MATPVRIEVIADTATARAELGSMTRSLVVFGDTAKVSFGEYTSAATQATIASDKLAISLARVPAGSTAAAEAIGRYQAKIESLQASQLAAAREIGSSMTRYITIPAALVGVAAVKMATDFQSQMLLIQTQAGASAREVKNLSGQVLDLAKSGAVQQGPAQLAQGLYHLESVGLRGADAMRALKVASNAAALGMAPLEDIATALAGAVTSNIKGAQDYQTAMGTLNAVVGAGNMRMSDLVSALGTGLLPKAKAAGVSLTEIGAALAVLTDRGIGAEQGATRLGQSLAFMEKQSTAGKKALADLGLDGQKLAAQLHEPNGLLTVVQELHDAIQRVGAVRGQQDILGAFGGGRSSGVILTLIQSLDSSISSLQGKIKQVQQTTGTLAASEAAQQKTAAAQFHKDLAQMEGDLVSLGNAMLPTVTAVANGVTKIGNAFSALPGPVKHELGIVAAALAISGPLLLAVAGATKLIRGIGTAFATIPLEAGPAIATTEGEIATLGATAGAAEASVAGLGTQLGLLSRIGPIAIPITLAAVGAPLAVAGLQWAGRGIEQAMNPGSATGGKPVVLNNLSTWSPEQIAAVAAQHGPEPYSWYLQHPARARQIVEAVKKRHGGTLTAADVTMGGRPGVSPEALQAAASLFQTDASSSGPVPAPLATPTLSAADALTLGLAANPNSIPLLRQKAAEDERTLATLKHEFESGKLSEADYVKQAKTAQDDLTSTLQLIASIPVKAARKKNEAARKAAEAARKAQREHATRVSVEASHLKTSLGGTSDRGQGGGLSPTRAHEYDLLIAFYKQEADDAGLTASERARYAALAVSARKKEQAEAQRDADTYERVLVDGAKAAFDKAKAIPGNVAGEEQALRAEIAALTAAGRNKNLSPTERSSFLTKASAARDELSNLRNSYAIPLSLQLDEARAQARFDAGHGSQTDLMQLALAEKKAAERAIKSGALGIQGLIAAWNVIDQANQTLGTSGMNGFVKANVQKLTAGLHGEQRKIEEMRIAQEMAHAGRVTGANVAGAVDGVTVHTTINIDGRKVAKAVTKHQNRAKGRTNALRTGRGAGQIAY